MDGAWSEHCREATTDSSTPKRSWTSKLVRPVCAGRRSALRCCGRLLHQHVSAMNGGAVTAYLMKNAAVHEFGPGTKRTIAASLHFGRYWKQSGHPPIFG